MSSKLSIFKAARLLCMGSDAREVLGLHTKAQKKGRIEDRASSDLERPSSRDYRPRHPSVQEETLGLRQSSGRSLRAPAVAVIIISVAIINRPFSGPPKLSKGISSHCSLKLG